MKRTDDASHDPITPDKIPAIVTHHQGIYRFGQNAGIDWFFVRVGRHVSQHGRNGRLAHSKHPRGGGSRQYLLPAPTRDES